MKIQEFAEVYYNLPEEERSINEWYDILTSFVVFLSNDYMNVVKSYEDRVQTAWIGVIKALNTYTLDKGFQLTSYISACVRNEFGMIYRKINRDLCDAKDENGDRVANMQLDATITTDTKHTISEIIGDEDPEYDNIYIQDLIEQLDAVCTPHQREVLRRLVSGQTLKEISNAMYKDRGNPSRTRKILKRKFDELNLQNNL